jgi:hypothetical protein
MMKPEENLHLAKCSRSLDLDILITSQIWIFTCILIVVHLICIVDSCNVPLLLYEIVVHLARDAKFLVDAEQEAEEERAANAAFDAEME